MERRRIIALVVILLVTSTTALAMIFLLQGQVQEPEDEFVIEPHPFNYLNWWDIAWELAVGQDFIPNVRSISSYTNRYDDYPGFDSAAAWMVEELQKLDLEASLWGEHNTPVGYQPGYGSDNRALVFGAHLDAYPGQRGVEQNAGGCAVVMMIASALARFRFPIDIYYCFFAGNLAILDPMAPIRMFYGSREVTEILSSNNVDVIAFFNFDELLFRSPVQSEARRLVIQRRSENYHANEYFADILIQHMRKSGLDIMTSQEDTSTLGDQDAFWDNGYPAITVRSGHFMDMRDPPYDDIESEDFNTTQAIYLARAAASVGTYLALKGNGEQTSQKLERAVNVNETAEIRTVLTVPQELTVSGFVNTTTSLNLSISQGGVEIQPTTDILNGSFSITTENEAAIGPITLTIENKGLDNATVDMFLNYSSDTDGDGTFDSDQYSWPDPEPPLDWDEEGLSDSDEIKIGTDIFLPDTDWDGINDSIEVENGLNPLVQDTQEDYDSDSLTNLREINLGTNPVNNDTDSDGMLDGWEVYFGTDPFTNDRDADPDNDTLTNFEEYTYGSDPHSVDGDNDGVSDVDEIERGMNPLDIDSDHDGLRDHLELLNGLDPLIPDYDVDIAPDGPDRNPRINSIIILGSIILVPVCIGSLIFWKRYR